MLDEAEPMDPEWMTEDCRVMRSIMTVYRGTDPELATAIGLVNKNHLSGAFLRIAHLISAGVRAIELADPKPLERVWEHEFIEPDATNDPIDIRIYQLLQSRVAMEQGDKRLARQWSKGKVPV